MAKISAVVFIFWPDEVNFIEPCLQSLSWVDEIIVIDNGAGKETVEKVKKYTKKIFASDVHDFAARHNLAQEKASGEWLLFVDSDERVSKSLQAEILQTLESPKHDAYKFNRINYFLAKRVRFGDRVPDLVTRLFKTSNLQSWSGAIHESSKVNGTIGELKSPFYHLTHRDIKSMMEKTINFSEEEALLRLRANHPPVVGWRLFRVFLTEMFNRLVKMQGYRQGTEGYIDGIFQAFSLFIVYARLWELQRKPSLSESYKEIDQKILQGEL